MRPCPRPVACSGTQDTTVVVRMPRRTLARHRLGVPKPWTPPEPPEPKNRVSQTLVMVHEDATDIQREHDLVQHEKSAVAGVHRKMLRRQLCRGGAAR